MTSMSSDKKVCVRCSVMGLVPNIDKFTSWPLQLELGSPAPVLEPLEFVSGECSSTSHLLLNGVLSHHSTSLKFPHVVHRVEKLPEGHCKFASMLDVFFWSFSRQVTVPLLLWVLLCLTDKCYNAIYRLYSSVSYPNRFNQIDTHRIDKYFVDYRNQWSSLTRKNLGSRAGDDQRNRTLRNNGSETSISQLSGCRWNNNLHLRSPTILKKTIMNNEYLDFYSTWTKVHHWVTNQYKHKWNMA